MSEADTSEFIRHEQCPQCGSKDNLARYTDGHGYCFGCGYYEKGEGGGHSPLSHAKVDTGLIPHGEACELVRRKLTQETCAKWGYTKGLYQGEQVQIANYRDITGHIIAQKLRFADKRFKFLGDTKSAGLYGQHLWRDGGKRVTITEGELDALSVSQVQGNRWPVVSLPTGASGAKRALQSTFEWLDGFEEIILMFDNDEAGREAVEKCASLRFKAGKLKVAKLPLKDASEMLMAGRGAEVVSAIFEAKAYRPDGIIAGVDLWEELDAQEDVSSLSLPFSKLQAMTFGARAGELWTVTAGSGTGKSSLVRELAYHFIQSQETVGMIMLEENIQRTARGLIGLALDLPAHTIWQDLSQEQRRQGFDATLGTGRVFLYDHFGSTSIDNILAKIRYMRVGCECSIVILDHLSIIVSGTDEGDERRLIDNIMTTLKSLAMELGIILILVSHLKRPQGDRGHEDGARTSLAQLRGSAAIAQLSDFVIGAERDQQSDNKNILTLRVLKNRYTGETGEAGHLLYNPETGRLSEATHNPFEENPQKQTDDFSTDADDAPF